MNLKVLSIVSGILLVLAAAAFGLNHWFYAPKDLGRVGQVLMPNVDPADVTQIDVTTPEHTVTLQSKNGSDWTVAQQDDFPVDAKKVKRLFIKLTTDKLDHKVSDDPGVLGDMGVLTRKENGGKLEKGKTGKVIRILGKKGKQLFAVILGNTRQGGGPMTFGGTYVRYPGDNAVYLIKDTVLDNVRPADWIDTTVLDVDAKKTLKSIRVENPKQRVVLLTRDKPADPWKLAGMPADKLDQKQVNDVADQFAGLDIFKVVSAKSAPADVGRKRLGHVQFELFDKRRFAISLGKAKAKDNFRYLTIQASLDPSVKDDKLKSWVADFNKRFSGRLLGVYDWDASRMLQAWTDYEKKPKGAKKS